MLSTPLSFFRKSSLHTFATSQQGHENQCTETSCWVPGNRHLIRGLPQAKPNLLTFLRKNHAEICSQDHKNPDEKKKNALLIQSSRATIIHGCKEI